MDDPTNIDHFRQLREAGLAAQEALTAEKAFEAYSAAASKAQHSRSLQDGIAAGRYWGQFIRLFEGAAQ